MTTAIDARPEPHTKTDPGQRRLGTALIGTAALLLGVVILTPVALSSQDLLGWAASPTGLALQPPWPVIVFISLDAAAGVCVALTVYSAWRGEPGGIFAVLVWCFAAGSAFANWRHGNAPGAAPDAVWFFPAMSLAGPTLLEAVLGRLRRWAQRDAGRRSKTAPSFGWRRWTPGLGATRDTYGSYRTALLIGIDTVDAAVAAYHNLCPDGSLRVAAALRGRHRTLRTGRHPTAPRAAPPPPTAGLIRRIPTAPDAYQRWRDIWTELAQTPTEITAIARRHGLSPRQIQRIRSAGQAGLLVSPIPPDSAARRITGERSPTLAWPGPPPQ